MLDKVYQTNNRNAEIIDSQNWLLNAETDILCGNWVYLLAFEMWQQNMQVMFGRQVFLLGNPQGKVK